MKKTTVVTPDFLDVGLNVITDYEEHEKEGQKWYYVWSQWEGFMGFAEDIVVRSEKAYIEGTVQGFHQPIKFEFPTIEAAKETVELQHELTVKFVDAVQTELKLLVMAKLGESLYGK